MPSFPDRLKELRKSQNKTQVEVARFLEIRETSYQYYEYGKREPNHEITMKIADYFDVSTDYLLGRSDNPERH